MAKYKVWLTVKDSYGNTKELPGGNIDIDLEALSDKDLDKIGDAFLLEEYIKKSESDYLATDVEVDDVVDKATANTVKYSGFKFRNTEEVGR